ncbi:unnamed protein product [Brassica oleracea]
MDVRGGCCIARYGGHYSLSKADRIMLRFRPIAPKPSSDGGCLSPVARNYCSTTTSGGSSVVSSNTKRGKRKYHKESSGVSSRRCNKRKRPNTATAVTLSLLPDLNVYPVEKQKQNGPLWLSFSGGDGGMPTPYKTAEISQRTVVVSSCVTVERVTDAWNDGYGLGKTDEEKKVNLMKDACPGFISDGVGRVTWTNEAYRKMAKEDINVPVENGAPEISYDNFHVIVRLVMKERPMLTYPAFTCRVRLQYTCQDRERGSVTVPCDVWRMDGGGFAWKLDVKTALCLHGFIIVTISVTKTTQNKHFRGNEEHNIKPRKPLLSIFFCILDKLVNVFSQLFLLYSIISMSHFFQSREWMDRHLDPIRNCVSEEFMEGIEVFLAFACNQESYQGTSTMLYIGEGTHRFLSVKRRRSDYKYFVLDLNGVVLVSKFFFLSAQRRRFNQ